MTIKPYMITPVVAISMVVLPIDCLQAETDANVQSLPISPRTPRSADFVNLPLGTMMLDKLVQNTVPTDRQCESDEGLAVEFHKLVDEWRRDTSFQSSLGEIFTNEAYQRIMAMGYSALPMILSALEKKPDHWFYALEKIVGYDVAAGSKSFAEARAAWLTWGYENNYI